MLCVCAKGICICGGVHTGESAHAGVCAHGNLYMQVCEYTGESVYAGVCAHGDLYVQVCIWTCMCT